MSEKRQGCALQAFLKFGFSKGQSLSGLFVNSPKAKDCWQITSRTLYPPPHFLEHYRKSTFSWESRKLDFDEANLGPGSRLPLYWTVYYTAKLLGNGWRLGAKRIVDSQNVVTTVTNFLDASHTSSLDTSSATFRTARKLWNVPPKKAVKIKVVDKSTYIKNGQFW